MNHTNPLLLVITIFISKLPRCNSDDIPVINATEGNDKNVWILNYLYSTNKLYTNRLIRAENIDKSSG